VIEADQLPQVLAQLPQIHLAGLYHRVVKAVYLNDPPPGAPPGSPPQPLWPGGASERGARYTPTGGANSLYLAPDPVTALAEVRAVSPPDLRANGPHDPLTVMAVEVDLPSILDLCSPAIRKALGITRAELVAPWLRGQARHRKGQGALPPTQALGAAAAGMGSILGLQYPSARRRAAQNLVVFTDHLASLGGTLVTVDTSGRLLQRLP
jgi:RES domain-containing protein